MTPLQWLTARLRLLYEYGEATTFHNDAEIILEGLAALDGKTGRVSLRDALDQAGESYTVINMDTPGTN